MKNLHFAHIMIFYNKVDVAFLKKIHQQVAKTEQVVLSTCRFEVELIRGREYQISSKNLSILLRKVVLTLIPVSGSEPKINKSYLLQGIDWSELVSDHDIVQFQIVICKAWVVDLLENLKHLNADLVDGLGLKSVVELLKNEV